MAKSLKSNPVVIQPGTTIGNISAEADDEFLFDCFVDHPALDEVRETTSSKMFVSARTGAGKTAIIRMIQRQYPSHSSSLIDLPDLSMDYVANSDIIRFLKSIDIDLDLFFQALWKHVLCIEYIRMRYKIDDEGQSRATFRSFTNFFKTDSRKQSAIRYLSEWEGKFFITMDENIKEMTSKLETKVSGELGAEVDKFSARAGYSRTLSAEKKAEIVARAKKIVNANQLADLNRVLDLLSDVDSDKKYSSPYYILIDRLDEKWVDEEIRFDLIRALVECLKSFNKIRNLKIIVAIREDVLEKVVQETRDVGFQREKYDDYFLRMQWTGTQLNELIRKRINSLYKRKYTSENVTFHDIFRSKIANKDPLDYILERTLYRPRDMISFVNECLKKAQGNTEVNSKTIRDAEAEYSRIRRQALIQEWQSAFPSLSVILKLLANRKARFKLAELANKDFLDEFALKIDHNSISENDPIKQAISQYMKNATADCIISTTRILVSQLYRIGAIGLKLSSGERYIYSYQDVPLISAENLDTETKIHIHPMLHRALNVSPEFSMRSLAGTPD